jgi:hypothetical protein
VSGPQGEGGAGDGPAGAAFRLVPFGGSEAPAAADGLAVEGRIARQGECLRVDYQVSDPAASLRIPPPAPAPRRRDELWQATCLELFLALPGQDSYREFNLSPSGDWAVYLLDGYRRGLRPDPAWTALPFTRQDEAGVLRLNLATTLPPELAAAPQLEAAITAVLQHQDGRCDYWALRHPGPEADFHRREGFGLRI